MARKIRSDKKRDEASQTFVVDARDETNDNPFPYHCFQKRTRRSTRRCWRRWRRGPVWGRWTSSVGHGGVKRRDGGSSRSLFLMLFLELQCKSGLTTTFMQIFRARTKWPDPCGQIPRLFPIPASIGGRNASNHRSRLPKT